MLQRTSRAIAAGNYQIRSNVKSRDELRELSASFNQMADTIEEKIRELEEAAELDGASKWQIFWNVTLPQLKPTTFFVIIMLTIASFKVYDQMYMITQGGPGNATMTLVYYIYNVAFVNTPKYGYASAVSMVLFVLVLFVTIIQFKGSSSND